jgi:hypothetical protein
LLLDELFWAVWAIAAVSIVATAIRTSRVAKQGRA